MNIQNTSATDTYATVDYRLLNTNATDTHLIVPPDAYLQELDLSAIDPILIEMESELVRAGWLYRQTQI